MSGKAVVSLTTGLEDPEKVTVAFLVAVGAVSGTALSFELGLLWPRYIELTGAVVGHLFGLEGYAFCIEAMKGVAPQLGL